VSNAIIDYKSKICINDQEIEILTTVAETFCAVDYKMSSASAIEPATVALTLHLMCMDICERIGIEVDDLIMGLTDSSIERH